MDKLYLGARHADMTFLQEQDLLLVSTFSLLLRNVLSKFGESLDGICKGVSHQH